MDMQHLAGKYIQVFSEANARIEIPSERRKQIIKILRRHLSFEQADQN